MNQSIHSMPIKIGKYLTIMYELEIDGIGFLKVKEI